MAKTYLIDIVFKERFEKLLKLRHVNLSAAACGKKDTFDSKDFATGYSCGSIKLFELERASTVVHKFTGGNFNMMSINEKLNNYKF